MRNYLVFIGVLALLLVGCERNPQVNAQLGTPEYIAGEFFHAIYNEKDLTTACSLIFADCDWCCVKFVFSSLQMYTV